MTRDATADTPAYIARCPVCNHIVACAVAPAHKPREMRDALTFRGQWERAGLVLSTGTVRDIRTAPDFGHRDGCPNDRRGGAILPLEDESRGGW